MTSMPILETRNLSKRFGGLRAVNDVSLSVSPGCVHGVIGPNGAGKTTLFNLITGEHRPSSGRVLFKGCDITGRPPHAVTAAGIARKFQITQVLTSLTVRDNVQLAVQRAEAGSMFRLLRKADWSDRVDEVLNTIHLGPKADAQAASLGHGERQRLELGMVLATGAELLLLDEPTSGMSLEERGEIGDLLREISGNATVVIVEHDFPFIKRVADTVTVLDKGELIAQGTVREIEADERVRDCYLGVDDHA